MTAIEVARWFLGSIDRAAGDSITHLKLQKLVYYAQAWSLALHDKSLFDEDIQAWSHGPVVESVWHEYKEHGSDALPMPMEDITLPPDIVEHLESVFETYNEYSAKHLEKLTHAEMPWKTARAGVMPEAKSNRPISKEEMRRYYKSIYIG